MLSTFDFLKHVGRLRAKPIKNQSEICRQQASTVDTFMYNDLQSSKKDLESNSKKDLESNAVNYYLPIYPSIYPSK